MRKFNQHIPLRNSGLYLTICFIAIFSLSLTPYPGWCQFIGIEPIDAILMEDHSDSFIAWRQANVKNRIVVHIDSHIDLEWISDSDIKRILHTKIVEKLRQLQLDPLRPEERSSKPLSIMNYIYPAMREGMVKEIYWVPPDSIMEVESVLYKFKNHLMETIDKLSIDDLNSFRLQKGGVKGKIFGIPLTICKLSDLPHFKEIIILDIDMDYFDPPNVEKRIDIPTIWPEDLIATLREKGISSDLVSICYSIRGGYLPLEYRFLGDELTYLLKNPKGSDQMVSKIRRHRKLGLIYKSKGFYLAAIDEFQKALELNPKDASLHYWLGLTYSQLGKSQEASKAFAHSASLDPIYSNPSIYDANYYLNKKVHDRALNLYEEILIKNPHSLKGIFGIAMCSSKQGNLEKAMEYYQKFIKAYPNFYLVRFNLGVVYSELKRWDLAQEEYKYALKLNPYFGKAYQNLGILYSDRGEIDKAIQALEKATEMNPCFKFAHNNLGSLYASRGNYDEAVTRFRNAIKIDPQYVPGYNNIGKIYLIQGNFKNAMEAFQQVLSIDPKHLWGRYYLAYLYSLTDRHKDAISAYEEVIHIDPNFYLAYFHLAKILDEKNIDSDKALKFALKAFDLKPTAKTLELLASLYYKRGMLKEAEKTIEHALKLDPSDESIIRHREKIKRSMKKNQ